MPTELEAKLKVDDLAPTRRQLQSLGAVATGSRLEVNALFDTPDQSLTRAGKGLRVRARRNLTDHTEDAILTFKGPLQPGTFKSREEIETHVENAAAATALLQALGFQPSLTFEKRRESWELARCHVELDEVPHLGFFVEIEGPDETTITAVQLQLGLAGVPPVKSSYIALLLQYLKDHGRADRVIRFP